MEANALNLRVRSADDQFPKWEILGEPPSHYFVFENSVSCNQKSD